MNLRERTWIAVVMTVVVAARAQTNIVKNGSFETGPAGVESFASWDWIGPADNNSDYGVAKAGSAPNVAEQGSYYAYFHGHPTDGSQDCLGQSEYLTVGARYKVSYYLGTDGSTAGSGASMWAVIGTSFGIDYSQDIALPSFFPDSSNALAYQLFTTNITATQPMEILSFHGIDATSSILLDNVSMELIAPELSAGIKAGNGLVFSWEGTNGGYRLQASASLGRTNWATLTNKAAVVGGNSEIMLKAPGSNVFYRLVLQ